MGSNDDTAWDAAHATEGEEAARVCSPAEVEAFLHDMVTAEAADTFADGDVTVTRHRHRRAVITTAEDEQGVVHKQKLD